MDTEIFTTGRVDVQGDGMLFQVKVILVHLTFFWMSPSIAAECVSGMR